MELLFLIIGLIIGGAAGYYYAMHKAKEETNTSEKSAVLQSLNNQVAEMKAKFDAYEKLRDEKEQKNEKLSEEKEKRYKEFTDSVMKLFEKQEKTRTENEEKRDKQMGTFASVIDAFNKTVHGTTTRGLMGEEILKQYLREGIKAKIIKTDLKTATGAVEYAWNLGDGMYVPIDAKLPDIVELVASIETAETQADKTAISKKILDKVKKEVERVRKYTNQDNTVNKAILAVPQGALQHAPELVEAGASKGVFVCSYEQVFLIGYLIAEEHERMREEGDVGALKDTNKNLVAIIKEVVTLTDSLERQAKSVQNFNTQIREKAQEGLRL